MNMNDIFMNWTVYIYNNRGPGTFQLLNRMCDKSPNMKGSIFPHCFQDWRVSAVGSGHMFKSRVLRCQGNRDHLSSTLCLFSISSLSFVWCASVYGRCTGLHILDFNQEEVAFMMETECIYPLWAERIQSWDPWQLDKTFWQLIILKMPVLPWAHW